MSTIKFGAVFSVCYDHCKYIDIPFKEIWEQFSETSDALKLHQDLENFSSENKCDSLSIKDLHWVKPAYTDEQLFVNLYTMAYIDRKSWFLDSEDKLWQGEYCGFCGDKTRQYETGFCKSCKELSKNIFELCAPKFRLRSLEHYDWWAKLQS